LGYFLAGLAVFWLAAAFEHEPGYMDAEYYFVSGLDLAQGKGLYLPVLWNYLNDPLAIPHPSHTYWMPLSALLAALGALWGGQFPAARLPFILAASLVPPLTVYVGLRLHQNKHWAFLGGLFALFPVYYLAYLPTTDSFGLYMLLGSGMLLLAGGRSRPILRVFLAGLLAGLMHMTRADGLMWGLVLVACVVVEGKRYAGTKSERLAWAAALGLAGLAGYLFPTMYWYTRNINLWGQLMPPGGSRALWLTRYEETFAYPANLLTVQRWLASGWQAILAARWQAFVVNLQTFAGVQGAVVLGPFMLIGLWRLRRRIETRLGAGLWLLTFAVMALVFPFAGQNGSFFHSGAAVQPLLWAAAPPGIAAAVDWLARLRRWQRGNRVQRFVEVLLVGACLLVSGVIFEQKVIGVSGRAAWNAGAGAYRQIEARLVELGATPCLAVMVNNPPGYYAATRRSAVVLPYGDEGALLAAGRAYLISYVIIDRSNAFYLRRLYDQPGDYPGLDYLDSVGDARIYAFTKP